ncbi:MAG: hypothetical protein ACKO1J_13950 [Tagaea sp.]
MFNAMALSSVPDTLAALSVGVSASPATVTEKFEVVDAVSVPSVDVAVTDRLIVPE